VRHAQNLVARATGHAERVKKGETHTASDPALLHEGVGTPIVEVWAGLNSADPTQVLLDWACTSNNNRILPNQINNHQILLAGRPRI